MTSNSEYRELVNERDSHLRRIAECPKDYELIRTLVNKCENTCKGCLCKLPIGQMSLLKLHFSGESEKVCPNLNDIQKPVTTADMHLRDVSQLLNTKYPLRHKVKRPYVKECVNYLLEIEHRLENLDSPDLFPIYFYTTTTTTKKKKTSAIQKKLLNHPIRKRSYPNFIHNIDDDDDDNAPVAAATLTAAASGSAQPASSRAVKYAKFMSDLSAAATEGARTSSRIGQQSDSGEEMNKSIINLASPEKPMPTTTQQLELSTTTSASIPNPVTNTDDSSTPVLDDLSKRLLQERDDGLLQQRTTTNRLEDARCENEKLCKKLTLLLEAQDRMEQKLVRIQAGLDYEAAFD